MHAATTSIGSLPAQRLDASGRAHVDLRAIVLLAAPFAANSAIQAVLNLTDTWFIGRISTTALAGIAAIHWPVIVLIALFGGVGLAGQTIVAQANGARRRRRAAQAGWTAAWAALFVAPMFDDRLMISLTVKYGSTWVSRIIFGPTLNPAPIMKPVFGLTMPSSRAAATVNTFITEPAS